MAENALFRFQVESIVEIAAPAEVVWRTLMGFDEYPQWSTMLHYVSGRAVVGEKMTLRLVIPQVVDYKFSPTIVAVEANRRFVWKTITGVPGIFDGEHGFTLDRLSDRQTRLTNREVYSGLLTPVIQRTAMMRAAPAGFVAMNHEIQRRAESLAVQRG
ncbi:MAG: SRPBCC domain-containing protein [Chloroflexota bacterium]|nr:SRPBCC domain-containing protein [Chloroflexota bacterium]